MSSKESHRPLTAPFKTLFSSSESIEYAVIDAFSEGAFGGNPAAVVLLSEWKDEKWLQDVAVEFNLSETAYLVKKESKVVEGAEVSSEVDAKAELSDDSDLTPQSKLSIHEYDLRWFTPAAEVDLCGHATLASGHLLFSTGIVGKQDTIFFHTKSGLLSVTSVGPNESNADSTSAAGGRFPNVELVELNFPWITSTPAGVSAIQALPGTLSNVEVVAASKAALNLIVELASSDDLEKIQPEVEELLRFDSDGLIATAPGALDSGYDFVSRCFFPKYGVTEDPVTGSAHSALGPYWSTKLGKTDLLAYQSSKRGGTLALRMDKKIGRVYIRGQATIVMAGVLV